MSQTLHIFRKDVRRFRYELFVVGALTSAFAWSHAADDMPGPPDFGRAGILAYLTATLLALAWWFLISQLIHEESLAGNRQFWITRPYSWRDLLAAKLLFVVAFVNLPLLLAQIAILAAAGYQPLVGIPSLLWMQFAVSVVLLVPPIALATVTRNLAQFVMFILCLTLGAYLVAATFVNIAGRPWPNRAVAVCIVSIGAVMIVRRQYARRLTDVSILTGIAILLLAAVPYIGLPIPVEYALRSWMLRPQETGTVSVSIAPDAAIDRSNTQEQLQVVLMLPTTIAGVPQGEVARPEIVLTSFDTPSGVRWSSGWIFTWRTFPISIATGPKTLYEHHLSFQRDFYRKIQGATVTLRGSMYLGLLGQTSQPLVPGRVTRIPGGGSCEMFSAGLECATFCSSPYRRPYDTSSGGGVDIDRGAGGIERNNYMQLISLPDAPWPDFALSPVFVERNSCRFDSSISFLSEDLRAWIRRDFAANVHLPAAP